MKSRDGRSWGQRAHLEFLEGRTLLSAVVGRHPVAEVGTVQAALASKSQVVVITGRFTGTVTEITPRSGINSLINGKGTARGLAGTVALSGRQLITVGKGITVSNGSATLTPSTAPRGSLFMVAYSGSGRLAQTGTIQSVNLAGFAVGTGALRLESGTFSGTITLNTTNGAFVLNITLRLKTKP